MRDIRSITIDLDDTLWAIHPVIARAEQCLRDWMAEHYPRTVELFTVAAVQQLRTQVVSEHADRGHDLGHLRREVLRRMGTAAGYDSDFVGDAFAVFDDARNEVEIYSDVVPALQALQNDYVLVALTNGNANLEKIGLGSFFDDVVTAASAGSAKPDRRIFATAVSAGGFAAHETLHVGDDPKLDVEAARQAGLRTAWVNRDGREWPDELAAPDAEIRGIDVLVQMLEQQR